MIKTNKLSIEEVNEIISDIKNRNNNDLTNVMDFLTEDFDETKQMVIDLTIHLDNIENLYNVILKEYKSRNNG
jgi:hypothetical protein